MGKTSIEWCDFSINPLRARDKQTGATGHFCVRHSTGCRLCYSSRMQSRFKMHEFVASNRNKVELFLHEPALEEVLRRKKPTRYFWSDMTDMFLDDYPFEWIDRIFAVMAATPQHTHMVLTKRPERMREYISGRRENGYCSPEVGIEAINGHWPIWPLPNVWLGISAESQEYLKRAWILLDTPAAVRFLSIEPLIEPVDLDALELLCKDWRRGITIGRYIDMVIIGGESGNGARPMDLAWARSIIAQCRYAQTAVFMKQLGRNPILNGASYALDIDKGHGGSMIEWPEDLRVRQFPVT